MLTFLKKSLNAFNYSYLFFALFTNTMKKDIKKNYIKTLNETLIPKLFNIFYDEEINIDSLEDRGFLETCLIPKNDPYGYVETTIKYNKTGKNVGYKYGLLLKDDTIDIINLLQFKNNSKIRQYLKDNSTAIIIGAGYRNFNILG